MTARACISAFAALAGLGAPAALLAQELAPAGQTVRYGHIGGPARDPDAFRLVAPPLLVDREGSSRTTAVFPFFYSRSTEASHELLAGPYYRRRAAQGDADVVFPFFWSLRSEASSTMVVPPAWYHTTADGFDLGVAPLFATGKHGESVYTVVPPLLTLSWANERKARTFAGPYWRLRTGDDLNWGVFPLLWARDNAAGSHVVAPPFFFRFTDSTEGSSLTIVPPFYYRATRDGASWGLPPLVFHDHDRTSTSWTVPPLLFHYSRSGERLRLVTPLFGWFSGDGEQTLVTPLYQRHRGDTELDAVAPFFFSWRDPREHASSITVAPLFHHSESPAGSTTLALPFFGRWHERGLYTTWATPLVARWRSHERDASATWIFPTLQLSHTPTSSTFNLHPIVYATEGAKQRHLVVAPLYWDFEDYEDRSRTTILFPLFWRFRDGASVSQVAGNTYYSYGRAQGVPHWELHVIPFFAYGEPRPGEYWWSVLYGLAGYERGRERSRTSVLWIPFASGPE